MTTEEQRLWNKIEQFCFDDPGTSFSFSTRLARENGWTKTYAARVVKEYKRFLFLCCVSNTGVTPSDPVDQAWHLHLTYTRSYWVHLCRNTLNRDIHHHPTKGGESEAQKFNGFYTTTHDLYKEKFGSPPPPDIWHDHHTRFTDIQFQRVNRKRYWLVQKPGFLKPRFLAIAGCLLTALFSVQAIRWDLPNVLFVGFLLLVGVIAYTNRNKRNSESAGCTMTSCGADGDSGSGHHGDSGCSSGCSGCSASGCSGCSGSD